MEKFEDNIQQLFTKAKNAPPPMSIEEAEAIVTSYKKGSTLSSFLGSAKGILLLAAAAAALCLAYFAVQGVGNGGADSSRISQNVQQAGVAAEAGKEKEITNSNTPLDNALGNIKNNGKNDGVEGKIKVAGKTPTQHTNKGETISKNRVKTVNTSPGSTNSEPQNTPVLAEDKEKEIFEEPGIIKAVPRPEPEEALAVVDTMLQEEEMDDEKVNTERDFVVEPFMRRNFIKTDLGGYFYELIAPYKSLAGNKFSISYERLLTRHLSAGMQFNTGYTPYSNIGAGSINSTTYEQVIVSKGWSVNLDARYYFSHRGTSRGPFAGAYFAHARYTENVYTRSYTDKNNRPPFNTAFTSKGYINAWGLFSGYRVLLGGRFVVEPLVGFIVGGSQSIPDNFYLSQTVRLHNLWRFELNIGYAF